MFMDLMRFTIHAEKNPRSKDENQQQTQLTYDIGPELNTGHELSRHSANPAPRSRTWSIEPP